MACLVAMKKTVRITLELLKSFGDPVSWPTFVIKNKYAEEFYQCLRWGDHNEVYSIMVDPQHIGLILGQCGAIDEVFPKFKLIPWRSGKPQDMSTPWPVQSNDKDISWSVCSQIVDPGLDIGRWFRAFPGPTVMLYTNECLYFAEVNKPYRADFQRHDVTQMYVSYPTYRHASAWWLHTRGIMWEKVCP